MTKTILLALATMLCVTITACRSTKLNAQQPVSAEGFGILSRLAGTWHGPVTSTTSAGSFPEWYVDFRPVSAGQISQFSMLDSQTVNNISFFVVSHENKLKVAMRTKGCFNNSCCITYEVIDSVNEKSGCYRFCDFQGGVQRASTLFTFSGDSMIMEVYTSKFNKEKKPVLHTRWVAVKGDKTSANKATEHFGFPKNIMVRNFNDVFNNMSESIIFDLPKDPYPDDEQPYTGTVQVDVSVNPVLKNNSDGELFILFTTQPIYDGLKLKPDYGNYYSRYVFLPAGSKKITIHNMHPGTYYLYAFSDLNLDKRHLKDDLMSSATDNVVVITESGMVNASVIIDMIIP